jgi:hypothetical protein
VDFIGGTGKIRNNSVGYTMVSGFFELVLGTYLAVGVIDK